MKLFLCKNKIILIILIVLNSTFLLSNSDNKLNDYSQVKKTNQGIDYSYFKLNKKTNQIFESNYIENKEVLYFFSYDCKKCSTLYSYIIVWEDFIKPINVNFKRIPTSTTNQHLSKLFFLRENLNFNNRFDNEIFKGLKLNKLKLDNDKDVIKLFENYFNIENSDIMKKINSKKMIDKIELSNSLFTHYSKIIDNTDTPMIIVNKNNRTYIITQKDNPNDSSMLLALNDILF